MPILVQNDLPAKQILEAENIFVMDERRASTQEIRPLRILILNLMPLKEVTELDLLRVLSNFPIQVQITFLKVESHESKHATASHLNKFYTVFSDIQNEFYDGMIITGAPVEQMEFEQVGYWEELCRIMEWTRTHVHSTFHICWGAQAGLYYHYGIPKYKLDRKVSGVFRHHVLNSKARLFRGFDDYFYVPHSRHTEVRIEDIEKIPELRIMAVSEEAGVYVVGSNDDSQFFVMGHSEYDADTLAKEYFRDLGKGMDPDVPAHYFPDDDPSREPMVTWAAHSQWIYSNWINYYVYQTTPYELKNGVFIPSE